MGGSEEQQRLFVTRGRPGAALTAGIAFGIAALLSDRPSLDRFLVVLVVSVVLTQLPAWAALARGVPTDRVARAVLLADIPMIAALTAALGSESLLVVAFFAPIAFAALIFGPPLTLVLTALASAAVVVVGVAFVDADWITILADLVVLGVTGAILAALSRQMHQARDDLVRERTLDEAALAISERVRSSLDFGNVLTAALREIGEATRAQRMLLRLPVGEDGVAPLYQWERPGVEPYDVPVPPPFVRRVFETGRPAAIPSLDAADAETTAFLRSIGAQSALVFPLQWQSRVGAVVGCTDEVPRDWERDVLPLFVRLSPQLEAAMAQAELFEQQQATLDEFRELSRLREELVANVSHELRTPLTSTIGFLHTLQRRRRELDDEQQEQFLGLALREAQRLGALVDDLLDLARLERGVLAMSLGPVDLREVVERAAIGLDLDGRELRVDLTEQVVARGDRDRLLQVFSNLLVNATKHGAGTISVSGDAGPRHVTVAICDRGPGIPHERISDLFVPFARWGARGDSTGLGLAIARGIVHAHGGTLFYRPAHGGSEHAFVVTLPREEAASTATVKEETMAKDHGPQIKDDELYEALREEGESKEKAARIANAAAAEGRSEVGRRGGESEDYDERTVEELQERAKEIGLEGYSDMRKDELISALRNH